MRRREFITLIGGATAGSSLAARAQQTAQLRRIGIVLSGNDKDPEMKGRVDSLRRGLTALGWVEGRNCSFEYRWPGSDPSRTEKASADIVRSAPDVIIAGNLLSARSLRKVTKTIPIIFVNVADPVGGGIVENLARTGGNITGFTAFEYSTAGKWLEILRDIAPTMKRVAFIFGGAEIGPTGENFYRILENVTPKMTLELSPIRVRNAADVQAGIDQFAAKPDGGLVVGAEPGGVLNRAAIIAAAARHRMPATLQGKRMPVTL